MTSPKPASVKPRDLFLGLGLAAAIAAAWILIASGGPELAPPGGVGPVSEALTEPAAPAEPHAVGVARDPKAPPLVVTDANQSRIDEGAVPTTGWIEISIVLTAGLPPISGYTLFLEEAMNPNAAPEVTGRQPYRKTLGKNNPDPGHSPIYAAMGEIPFSEYGYRVGVFVPGINGSDQFVRLDKSSPTADVTLQLSPASPFHLRLMDQYRNPLAGKHVAMRPKGWPQGRPIVEMDTDSFGVAIFEGLLAGAWDVWMDEAVRGEVLVAPPGIIRDDANLGVASKVLTIPMGRTLKVDTYDAAGWGLQDVDLVLTAIDTTENRRFTARSDQSGSYSFTNVTPGRWQLHASGRGHQTRDVAITVEVDKDPEPLKVHLVRLQ